MGRLIILCFSLCLCLCVVDATLRDVVICLDRSGSVAQSDFVEAVDFVYNVTKWLTIGQSDILISVVTFATQNTLEFNLNDYPTNETLLDAIQNLTSVSTGGGTSTYLALEYIHANSFQTSAGGRASAPKAVVVLTDGRSRNTVKTADAAKALQDAGVEVYAIGIGDASVSTNTELSDIASDPDSYYLHTVGTFQYLCLLLPELVPKLDNETLASAIYRCPTPSPLTFLDKNATSLEAETEQEADSSIPTAALAAVSVVGVAILGAGIAAGTMALLNHLKMLKADPIVKALVAQYKDAPLGQARSVFSGEINDPFAITSVVPSLPPIESAMWRSLEAPVQTTRTLTNVNVFLEDL